MVRGPVGGSGRDDLANAENCGARMGGVHGGFGDALADKLTLAVTGWGSLGERRDGCGGNKGRDGSACCGGDGGAEDEVGGGDTAGGERKFQERVGDGNLGAKGGEGEVEVHRVGGVDYVREVRCQV